jgi:hypothetical protein
MSGSIRAFNYTDDSGIGYLVNIDESNAKTLILSGSIPLFDNTVQNLPPLSNRLKMRYLNCRLYSYTVQYKRFYVQTPEKLKQALKSGYLFQPNSGNASDYWTILSSRPEIFRPILLGDSGLDDGTPGLT